MIDDGTFTIEQEELHLPAVAVDEPESVIEATQVSEQKSEPQCSPQIQESIHRVLDELKIQSGNLDYADVADSSGAIIHAVGAFAQTKSPAIRETIMKVGQFSEQVSQELDLGPLDETIILSETGLMLLYPVENFGTMGVAAPKEDQGMMRWNCKEALEKMTEILST